MAECLTKNASNSKLPALLSMRADLVPLFSVYVTHYPVTPKINSTFFAVSYSNALRSFWSSSACFKYCHLFLYCILCLKHECGISPETGKYVNIDIEKYRKHSQFLVFTLGLFFYHPAIALGKANYHCNSFKQVYIYLRYGLGLIPYQCPQLFFLYCNLLSSLPLILKISCLLL